MKRENLPDNHTLDEVQTLISHNLDKSRNLGQFHDDILPTHTHTATF